MFDTHCHLNFKAFESQVDDIIKESKNYGVYYFMIPGTDYATSKRAVEISEKYKNAFCSVGLHPHHIYEFVQKNIDIDDYDFIGFIKVLVESDSVKAIGEVGFDRHVYTKTKYQNYKVNEVFLSLQKKLFIKQYDMALKLDKSLIIHCREAESDLLAVLGDVWDSKMQGRAVFHCCPASGDLLKFALEQKVFIGVDGDATYDPRKQAFIKKVPLDLLVLETDSPFLMPEPIRSERRFPNTPANLRYIAEICAYLKDLRVDEIVRITTENAFKLFRLK